MKKYDDTNDYFVENIWYCCYLYVLLNILLVYNIEVSILCSLCFTGRKRVLRMSIVDY